MWRLWIFQSIENTLSILNYTAISQSTANDKLPKVAMATIAWVVEEIGIGTEREREGKRTYFVRNLKFKYLVVENLQSLVNVDHLKWIRYNIYGCASVNWIRKNHYLWALVWVQRNFSFFLLVVPDWIVIFFLLLLLACATCGGATLLLFSQPKVIFGYRSLRFTQSKRVEPNEIRIHNGSGGSLVYIVRVHSILRKLNQFRPIQKQCVTCSVRAA